MKRKRKKKNRNKKKRHTEVGLLLIFIVIGLSMIFIFRQDIPEPFKAKVKKREVLREKKTVLLYFLDREDEYLVGEKREILKRGEVNEEAKKAIIELIKGPKGRLIPTLPPRTRLLTLRVNDEGVAEVNFDKALSEDHPGGSSAEMMTIYSIVNSLTANFPEIKKVQILIEGKPGETIAGHLSLKQPVPPNPELIKRQ
ncbi:MAG: GerMN domain-containing protein [Thermodesulfobacteriota bacterium]|jgi:spore germination protein GerM